MYRVLLVEDSPVFGSVLATFLGRHGFGVIRAGDGIEALARLDEAVPDVLILDLVLPNLDGFQLLESMRQRAELAVVPVLVLSALTDSRLAQKLGAFGVRGIMLKGEFSLADVLQRATSLVEAAKPSERDRSAA